MAVRIDTSISPYEMRFIKAITNIGDIFVPVNIIDENGNPKRGRPPQEKVKKIYPNFILTEKGNTYLWQDLVMSYRAKYQKGVPIDETERERYY